MSSSVPAKRHITMASTDSLAVSGARSAYHELVEQLMTITIRALAKTDEAEWRRLWTSYLEFYETSVTEEVYHTTFSRLLGEDAQDYQAPKKLGFKGGEDFSRGIEQEFSKFYRKENNDVSQNSLFMQIATIANEKIGDEVKIIESKPFSKKKKMGSNK